MNRSRLVYACSILCTAAACNADRLSGSLPDLRITPTSRDDYADLIPDPPMIDLGEVALYSSRTAVFDLFNPTTDPLNIIEVVYPADLMVGGEWEPAVFEPVLDPAGNAPLQITYAPTSEGAHQAVAEIRSDAASNPHRVTVKGIGVFLGGPDIAIDDNDNEDSTLGPLQSDCDAGGVCRLPPERALDFGTVAVGQRGTLRLYIRNTASCPPFPNAEECTTCTLQIDRNPEQNDIGLGFKAGTNDQALFRFASSTAVPFAVLQREAACGSPGYLRFPLEFVAPAEQGDFSTVIVVESNDPDEPVVEIPVVAKARNAPIAVVDFRGYDVNNPSAPWSSPDDLRVLNRMHFDGRQSYDPTDPTDPSLIDSYRWQVISYPSGANPADFSEQSNGDGFFSFWAPMVGNYTVSLSVHSSVSDTWSGETDLSQTTFFVGSSSRLHVELAWDHATNDQDLHMVHANANDALCVSTDCYFASCNATDSNPPIWFSEDPAREGSNPQLDIDDTDGLGPENINIANPRPGTYRIYVHYYSGLGTTRNTVKIWLDDILVAEYRRRMDTHQVWAVADITWYDTDTGQVTPYPSDAPNEVGAIGADEMVGCGSRYIFQP